jgi:hypothetical protein
MAGDNLDPEADCFKPPAVPIEVHCIHCGSEYESYRIEWRIEVDANGSKHGFWCCPIEGCDGKGFGFDILPTDPEYRDENGGWVWDDDDEDPEAVRWQAEDEEAPFHDPSFDAEKELTEILKDMDETKDDPEEEIDDEDQRPF